MSTNPFKNKNVLITAGPTQEALDPVRYISNHSSGKTGYAIAEAFLNEGANVYLISGPASIKLESPDLEVVRVRTANEMYEACCLYFEQADIVIFSAAVADYRPKKIALQKIKKNSDSFSIKMIKNIDIAYELGRIKKSHQLTVGFALETNQELQHAIGKLNKKNLDMLVLNSMNDQNATFEYDTNKITIIKPNILPKKFSLKHKTEVAQDIIKEIALILIAKQVLNETCNLN